MTYLPSLSIPRHGNLNVTPLFLDFGHAGFSRIAVSIR